MAFPFLKKPESYIKEELKARLDPIKNTSLTPWIRVTSNLAPDGYTLATDTYQDIFGVSGAYQSGVVGDANFKPNPIVTAFSLEFASKGVTKQGTIKFECFTRQQLDKLQKYFSEPGISVFVQWGWNKSAQTGQKIVPLGEDEGTQNKFWRQNDELNKERKKNNGCYDNILGIVTSAKSNIAGNTFTLETKITTIGEVLMGMKTGDPTPEEEQDKTVIAKRKVAFYNNRLRLYRQADKGKHKFHWGKFYNILPDFLKSIDGLKMFGLNGFGGLDAFNINTNVDFLNYDEFAYNDVKDEMDGGPTDSFVFLGKKIEGETDEVPLSDTKYIRFDAFIKILNFILYSAKGINITKVNVSIENSYCGAFAGIFSINKNCFIPNKTAYNWFLENEYWNALDPVTVTVTPSTTTFGGQYSVVANTGATNLNIDNSIKGLDGTIVSFPKESAVSIQWDGQTYTYDKPNTVGWIGDLYVEHDLAVECLKDSLNTPIKDCLDKLLQEMEKGADDLWDFQIIDDPSGSGNNFDKELKLTIVDANLTNLNRGENFERYKLFGPESVFLDFNFEFDLPKGQTSKIFFEKSTGKTGESVESGGGVFSDANDRIFNTGNCEFVKELPPDTDDTSNKKSEDEDELDDEAIWTGFAQSTKLLLQPNLSALYYDKIMTTEIDSLGETFEKYLVPGVSNNKKRFDELRRKKSKKESASSAPMNINITFDVPGISGFVVGDMLLVENLPERFTRPGNGAFMVKKVNHAIDKSGWVTTIEAFFRPYAN